MDHDVTIVVATRNRRDELLHALPHHRGLPVVVVDNASTDGSAPAVRAAHPGATVVTLRRNRGAAARNIGVRLARTPFVAFADDDSWWAEGALDLAARLLRQHLRLGVVAGRILLGPEEREDPLCDDLARSPLGHRPGMPGPSILGFACCGAVLRREAFLRVGGFDRVVFFPGEEERVALDLRAAGWDLVYVPEIVAHHWPSPSRSSPDARAVLVERNTILTAWMRRPLRVALGRHRSAWRAGGVHRTAALATLPRLPAALALRRPLPVDVERDAALLDGIASRHPAPV